MILNRTSNWLLALVAWIMTFPGADAILARDSAKFIAQEMPSSVVAGGCYRAKLIFKNTGSTAWREVGGVGSYRLGSASPENNNIWRPVNRILLAPGQIVAPGATVTFEFDFTAPEIPGRYRFQWQMLLEGSRYFGDKSHRLDYRVTVAPDVFFNFDHTRICGIVVKGRNLLHGTGGVYLIGSSDGSDAQGRSVTSRGASHGVMSSDNPSKVPPPPYRLSFSPGVTPNTLKFRAEVGPVPIHFATLSMPFDFRRDMVEAFKFDGASYRLQCTGQTDGRRNGSGASYDAVPMGCEIRNTLGQLLGRVGAVLTDQPTRWGEVSGPFGKVRVTITRSSRYRSMHFFNHFGTKNLELSWGRLRRGETAFIEGEIVVMQNP